MTRPQQVRRVAALYDIHGNVTALNAVLQEVSQFDVDGVVIGGDIAWGPEPVEVVDRVMTLRRKAWSIRGNADREVAGRFDERQGLVPDVAAVNVWCAEQLSVEQREFLGSLPERVTLKVVGLGRLLFCHGSPRSDEEPIGAQTDEAALEAMLGGVNASIIFCGHTHVSFDRQVMEKRIVNPGSVGLHYGEGARWALIGPEIELRRTEYDVRAAVERVRRSDVPLASRFVEHLLNPWPTPM